MSKNKIITFKIEDEAKENFEKVCKDKFQTPSQALYSFVHTQIKHSKSKPISLNNLNRKS